jgi:DNA-binding NtrC family response regulator
MSQSEGRKVTVLIVEDELLIRWSIAEYLQDCGFTVISASHGEEAVAAIKDYTSKIDVVFSDIRMPGEMDGFGLARWIEANRPDMAVILTSGHAGAEEAAHELCEKHGEIMRKPYSFEDVATRLRHALKPNI